MKKTFFWGFLILLSINFVFAHAGYVLDGEEFNNSKGADYSFFLSPIFEKTNLILISSTIVIFFVLYFTIGRLKAFKEEVNVVDHVSKRYGDYIPWMARIAISITLIGAGTSGVLISEFLKDSVFGWVQILLGFLIFIGLFTGIATFLAGLLFLYALFVEPYLIGNLDFLALCLVILGLSSGRPGIGDIFGFKMKFHLKPLKEHLPVILTSLMGIAIIYLALFEKILNPHMAELIVHNYSLMSVIPVSAPMWVFSVGVIELLLGLCLFFRVKLRLVSSIAFMVLSLSFFYFNEAVYSHITLFMALFIIFILGKKKKLDSHYLYLNE